MDKVRLLAHWSFPRRKLDRTRTACPSTTKYEQHPSNYKPHVRCWVYPSVPAHGGRCPFSTGTRRRSQRLSFFSSDRNRTTVKYNSENRTATTTTDTIAGGKRSISKTTKTADAICGRQRRQDVISNVTYRKQRTGQWNAGMASRAVNRNKWAHDTIRVKPLKTFHNCVYAAA